MVAAGTCTVGKDGGTVDTAETERFSALAEQWWDPHGEFRPLHKLNPVRLHFIRDLVSAHFDRDPLTEGPLAGLRLLDIGCGGGLLSEPMARLGAEVVGVDAAAKNASVARLHAEQSKLEIDYRHGSAEDLLAEDEQFDVILNMEVVEHVADVDLFLGACAEMLRPGGCMVAATLNRTPKSFALAIVGAEYVLRWLPRGTHDWRKFVRPSELVTMLQKHDLNVEDIVGVTYNPLTDKWNTSRDIDINYMIFAIKRDGD